MYYSQVVAESADGLLFKNKKDRKILNVNLLFQQLSILHSASKRMAGRKTTIHSSFNMSLLVI